MSDIQNRIARAVEARKYREGWSDEQYLARQLCKVTEELMEAVETIEWRHNPPYGYERHPWVWGLEEAGGLAEDYFDASDKWDDVVGANREQLAAELADVLIPLFVAADVLGVDLLEMAVEKAERDVERGVR